jgi:hypothetical protein
MLPVEMMMIKPSCMIKKRAFVFPILLFSSILLQAQQNDFQLWPSLQVNVEFLKNFKFHVEEELRLRENASLFSKQINDLGISYRINPYVKAAIFYRLEADWKNADNYQWRNAVYGDLSFKYKISRVTMGYRFRGQSAKAELSNNETSVLSGFVHRHKISFFYNIKGIPLKPFGEFEVFAKTGKVESGLTDYRTWVGLEYQLKDKHIFFLRYGISQQLNKPDAHTAYILSAGYILDISLLRSDE